MLFLFNINHFQSFECLYKIAYLTLHILLFHHTGDGKMRDPGNEVGFPSVSRHPLLPGFRYLSALNSLLYLFQK